jgi:putative CocE/NonD family hydrolase
LIGGWQDIFLPWLLEDFDSLQAAGHDAQLIIGPWTHTAPGLTAAGIREGLAWLRAGLLDDRRLVRPAKVRIYVTGQRSGGGWREEPSWPLPNTGEQRLWLSAGAGLQAKPPTESGADGDRYRYDPADPTPSLGGPVLLTRQPIVDNRVLERRPDVLTYTTAPLPETVEAIGPVRVELVVWASLPYFDLFARLCDVDTAGASWNVSDSLARVAPDRLEPSDDGTWQVGFDLWPIAHRFAAGNRIRLQVSSGAHPRYLRNPGTGADSISATSPRPVDIEILHDPEHQSALILPHVR